MGGNVSVHTSVSASCGAISLLRCNFVFGFIVFVERPASETLAEANAPCGGIYLRGETFGLVSLFIFCIGERDNHRKCSSGQAPSAAQKLSA